MYKYAIFFFEGFHSLLMALSFMSLMQCHFSGHL